jgi:hypothetical protein
MGRPIEITRFDLSAIELRELASRTREGAVVRRLLAIALILEVHSREEAARLSGMDRQTLRDWVHRYNADGVAGLCAVMHYGGSYATSPSPRAHAPRDTACTPSAPDQANPANA